MERTAGPGLSSTMRAPVDSAFSRRRSRMPRALDSRKETPVKSRSSSEMPGFSRMAWV